MSLSKTVQLTRATFGDDGAEGKKNIVSVSFGYSDNLTPNTDVIADADTPLPITLKAPQTLASDDEVTVTGRNSEGKPITEVIDGEGVLAFKNIDSIDFSSGTEVSGGELLGIPFRNLTTTDIRVLETIGGVETLTVPESVTTNSANVEENTVEPSTPIDGETKYRIYSIFHNWHLNPVNDDPDYGVPADVLPTGVELTPATATIDEEDTVQLTASVIPANATNQNVTFESSDDAVATVDENGLVTGVSEGTATITVTTEVGAFTDDSVITVTS